MIKIVAALMKDVVDMISYCAGAMNFIVSFSIFHAVVLQGIVEDVNEARILIARLERECRVVNELLCYA